MLSIIVITRAIVYVIVEPTSIHLKTRLSWLRISIACVGSTSTMALDRLTLGIAVIWISSLAGLKYVQNAEWVNFAWHNLSHCDK